MEGQEDPDPTNPSAKDPPLCEECKAMGREGGVAVQHRHLWKSAQTRNGEKNLLAVVWVNGRRGMDQLLTFIPDRGGMDQSLLDDIINRLVEV
ncbi:hypothetical protein FH972_006335 [Carpinus fangiana]|uniref:Uncharacterized protein n=1 Tax=Carpinus fangiana TaxID=176857 RepID=A0A5N6QUD6_9ROSI|nr:hypothetical protein FH972_006335 [Carpinus fangiana]